jgi:GNAT superfamily N-acetyltransferase
MNKKLELDPNKINYKNVTLEAYHDMASFYCKNHSMEEFLKRESYPSHLSRESSTTLVYYDSILVAYFTLQRTRLKIEFEPGLVEETHKFALDLTRIAVANDYQNKGIGSYILNNIIEIAYRVNDRFITTDALFEKWEWYNQFGFDYLKEDEVNPDSSTGLVYMLLDLYDPELLENFFDE